MLSHRNLCSELEMVSILQPVYPDDVFLSILPLSHTYECSLGMLLPVMWGASVVYLDKAPTASVLLPVLKKVRPTIMLTVPLIIEKIYKNKILPQVAGNRLMAALYKTDWGRRFLHRCRQAPCTVVRRAVSASSVSAGRNSIRPVDCSCWRDGSLMRSGTASPRRLPYWPGLTRRWCGISPRGRCWRGRSPSRPM